ncbi:MAG: Stp1/IreP family PP2C-type Ser/Thr phosphatase [Bdellovibrionales bacterium]|nr:Stp1/IreP family PP2C-type Ser/Thr phosphatase [Bdellovibrionales bacterium]
MGFEVWAQTDVGLKREKNEDSILVDKKCGLFIVADGMGGHEGGEVASSIAVRTAHEIISKYAKQDSNGNGQTSEMIRTAFSESTRRIFNKSHVENPKLAGMGTTMVLGFLSKGSLFVGNVGDSRCYMFKNNKLWQISEDHSLVQEQIRAGLIREEDSEKVVGKNVITRSVGFEDRVETDVFVRKVDKGEMFLFCSDGLSGLVSDREIGEVLATTDNSKAVPRLISMAKKAGGDDNVSVVLVKII